MKKFCQSLREQEMEIIKFKKKKNDVINKKWHKNFKNANFSYICKEKLEGKHAKDKKYRKALDYCHYTGEYVVPGHIIRNLKHRASKKIPMGKLLLGNYPPPLRELPLPLLHFTKN